MSSPIVELKIPDGYSKQFYELLKSKLDEGLIIQRDGSDAYNEKDCEARVNEAFHEGYKKGVEDTAGAKDAYWKDRIEKIFNTLKEYGGEDIYGDARLGDFVEFTMPYHVWQKLTKEEGSRMEKQIEKARNEICGSLIGEISPLTQCASDIAQLSITTHTGELRDKALQIAKAIADYEDALKASSNSG